MDRRIRKEVTVSANVKDVWNAWTTPEGVTTFFASKANVEFRIGGRYEMLFDLDAKAGSQGGEGLKILSYLPEKMLSFDWNAPPSLPNMRKERTWVVVQFEALQENMTSVELIHLGWGDSEEWDKAFEYFFRAWEVVLGRLAYRFSTAPIDWNDPYTPVLE